MSKRKQNNSAIAQFLRGVWLFWLTLVFVLSLIFFFEIGTMSLLGWCVVLPLIWLGGKALKYLQTDDMEPWDPRRNGVPEWLRRKD